MFVGIGSCEDSGSDRIAIPEYGSKRQFRTLEAQLVNEWGVLRAHKVITKRVNKNGNYTGQVFWS